MRKIQMPMEKEIVQTLKAGEELLLSGSIFSARDQAHKRLVDSIKKGEKLPFMLHGGTIFYMGPAPAPDGCIIGSCGPTTSSRMDPFTPILLENGLYCMIGKGKRSDRVVESIIKNSAVYLYAYGGCGALYSEKVEALKLIAYPDLGPEAVYKLEIKDFPVLVGIDSKGGSVFT